MLPLEVNEKFPGTGRVQNLKSVQVRSLSIHRQPHPSGPFFQSLSRHISGPGISPGPGLTTSTTKYHAITSLSQCFKCLGFV